MKPADAAPDQNRISDIAMTKKRIVRQAALTVLTLVLTVVIVFAMTSAWYSNVVQTSGLTFEAESWGFDGEITLADEAIQAAPGDGGIIDLTVDNQSDFVSAISVNISKDAMSDEMQKRMYFYVDTHINREEETVERVYLNQFEGYTYYVFNNSFLTLTEEYSNAPLLKWEWVYDVLGYYVLGEPYTVTDEDGNEIQKMRVEEYLRPIQYDYDQATTVINTEGETITIELATVDGIMTPEEFLEDISKNDGYPGTIDAEKDHAFGNYYKVDVEKNDEENVDEGEEEDQKEELGYGVYAYLCNYSEIQEAIRYDTKLGELAYNLANNKDLTSEVKEELQKKLQYPATITLSAQKDNNTVATVSTASGLQEAIAMNMANVIQLDTDVTIGADNTIRVPANGRVVLDLNGKTLINQGGTAIKAEPGSCLTLTGGTLIQADQGEETNPATTYAVRSVGAEVVVNEMTIQDFKYGVYVGDNADDNELDSRVHIKNSKIDGETCAAFISGNGLLTGQKSYLIIEDSELYSPNIVVSGNGDAKGNGRWGTDIQILNSKIIGTKADETDPESPYGSGIYQPQMRSTLLVKDSEVSGCNGIVLKGGIGKIHNSLIIGKGKYQEPKPAGSGFVDTGDAVYVETGYGYEIQLFISGNSILQHGEDEGCKSLRLFKEDADNVLIKIISGIFQEKQPEHYLEKDSEQEKEDDLYVITSPNEKVEETEEAGDTENTEGTEATGDAGPTGDANNETTEEQ